MNSLFHHAAFGLLLLLPLVAANTTPASSYFPNLSTDEKEEYTNWLSGSNASSYSRHAFMTTAVDSADGAAVFWNIDGDNINVAVAVRALGWVGFGISEAGGMLGADMALYQPSTSQLVDAYVVEDLAMPLTDDCQDWTLNGALHVDGWIIVEMSRMLDTKDAQDHAIKNDVELWVAPTRLIVAWGDTDSISYHGNKNARSALRLFADSNNPEAQALMETLEEESDNYFEIVEEDYEVPAVDTYYHEVCKTFDELNLDLPDGQTMITMIGGVPIITEDTLEFLHHFLVYLQTDCSGQSLQQSMVYAWAPGDEGWALPGDVGFPMFDTEYKQAVRIQIHYNNPSLISGRKDSSGIRLYYTHSKRTHDAAMLELGDPYLELDGETINSGLTQYEFTCPGKCSSTFLGNQGVTVISEFLHMHKTGVKMTNEVIRGDEIFRKAAVDVFEFDQQGAFHVHQDAYELLPGDSFRTTCHYRDGDKFGESSQEEMCIAYVMYYPAKQLIGYPWICPVYNPYIKELQDYTGCAGELEHIDLNGVDDLGRNFGSSPSECAAEPKSSSPPTGGKSPTGRPTTLAPFSSVTGKESTTTLAEPTTSGASWHVMSSLLTLPTVYVLLLIICM